QYPSVRPSFRSSVIGSQNASGSGRMLRPVIPEAGLVVEASNDVDRALEGVDAAMASLNPDGQSSIAWTLGHVTEHLDRMINHALQGRDRHPVLGVDRFRMGSEGV